jgi:ectoine hydroxylase-related dioxygenase (phytanoyl-CoA dioxygenase family)
VADPAWVAAGPGAPPVDPTTASSHAFNDDFAWPAHPGPFQVVSPEQARAYDDDGFFVLDDVFDEATLARMRTEIAPHEQATNEFLRQIEGGRISVAIADALTVTVHLVNQSAFLRDLCAGPALAAVARDLIGPDVRLYWDQAVYKFPDNPDPVPWHQDNGYTYVEPQAYLTCWIPLVDATVDNGCVWVLPGLHHRGTLEHWNTDLGFRCLPDAVEGAVAVPAKAGSIVVFSSLTPHWTGPNTTDQMRSAYIVQYVPDGAETVRSDQTNADQTNADQPTNTARPRHDRPRDTARRDPVHDPRRQYPVVAAGALVGAPPLT